MKLVADEEFRIFAAPLQGLTEGEFRGAHAAQYGHVAGSTAQMEYFTPFIRMERGEVRARDLRDADAARAGTVVTTPQVICRDASEFRTLVTLLAERGHRRVDLNMGCPFPPQVKRGRGAGLLRNVDEIEAIGREMSGLAGSVEFSVKMRLGVDDAMEWRGVVDALNAMPLRFVTIHPRTASQQYRGELHHDAFGELAGALEHRVVFNGEVSRPSDVDELRLRYPGLAGVMLGRGLLRRPSLAVEWAEGEEWSAEQRRRGVVALHGKLVELYENRLTGGERQLLDKLKPFWEYLGADFDRKGVKKVMKAPTVAAYVAAVNMLVK